MMCLASALAFLSVCVAAQAQGTETGNPVLVPGGFVDSAAQVVYVKEPVRGIAALGVRDGRVRWQSTDASKPLAVAGGRLLALDGGSGTFRIAALDVETGRLVCASDAVALDLLPEPPYTLEEVLGADHEAERSYFQSRAWVREGALLVAWRAGRRLPITGTTFKPEILERYERSCVGLASVDPDTCALQRLPGDGTRPSFSPEGGTLPGDLPETVRDVAKGQRWEFGVVVGNRVYGSAPEPDAEGVGSSSFQVYAVEAVDLATGERIWRRRYENRRIASPSLLYQ